LNEEPPGLQRGQPLLFVQSAGPNLSPFRISRQAFDKQKEARQDRTLAEAIPPGHRGSLVRAPDFSIVTG